MENRRIVMIPGPTPVVRSIQDQMGRDTQAFGDPLFVGDYKEVIKGLKELWSCDGEVFVVAASGTLGMEMAIANTLKAGDNLLIISHGFFGDRFVELCERKGIVCDIIKSEWGTIVPVSDIDKKLSEKSYQAVTITHVDTATGVIAPIDEIGEMMKKYPETIYILDGVCATAGVDEDMQKFNIDVLLTGSQKAFGVPPGLTMVWANKRAMVRRETLGNIPEYYTDFYKWLPIMQDPSKYYATPSINLIWAMKESIRIIKEEGLQNRYARHAKVGKAMQAALEALGFTILAEKAHRAPTLSNVIYPEGVNDLEFRNGVYAEGIVVAGGLAAYAGKMFRIGHMGNIDIHELVAALATIERTLYKLGKRDFEFGKGVGTFLKNIVD
ncbi:MAG: alanine--glyoxylate aminotransferase family protein [Clostridiales bacterium]|nr:alanine--glyoxylate aminotransferase family protein [Clostridiales bacterium]